MPPTLYRYFHPPNDHAQGAEAPIPIGGATAALVLIGLFALIAILCAKGGR